VVATRLGANMPNKKKLTKGNTTVRKADIEWPSPWKSSERLPNPKLLVLAWKPIINGWDIVLGREVVASPHEFTHWLPIMPAPEL
jgi:hypothetical protein